MGTAKSFLYKRKGTIRGMHFQQPPDAEIKMVKCINGKVLDVIIDLRNDSSTFLQWAAVEISGDNRLMLYIPKDLPTDFKHLRIIVN